MGEWTSPSKRVAQVLKVLARLAMLFGALGMVPIVSLFLAKTLEQPDLALPVPLQLAGELFYTGLGMFVAGPVLLTVANLLGWRAPDEGNLEEVSPNEQTSRAEQIAMVYRGRLQQYYLGLAGLIALFVVTSTMARPALLAAGPWGGLVSTVAGLAILFLFGTPAIASVTAALLAGLWLGIRAGSAEVLLFSFVVAVQFLGSALLFEAWGLVPAALGMCYLTVRARKATSFRLTDGTSLPRRVRKFTE